jgi:hypothetical protein
LSAPWRCGYFQSEVKLRTPREGRTVVKSFRVNEDALGALQDEADRKSVSINTLVNQLFLDYSEFGRFSQGINALQLSRKTFAEILNSVSDEDLVRAGRTAGGVLRWP